MPPLVLHLFLGGKGVDIIGMSNSFSLDVFCGSVNVFSISMLGTIAMDTEAQVTFSSSPPSSSNEQSESKKKGDIPLQLWPLFLIV